MTQDQIKEALAKAINGPHLPVPKDCKHTLQELRDVMWQNVGNANRQLCLNQAAAVMALVGPKPLHWMGNGNHWAGGRGYVVRRMPPKGRYVLTSRNQHDQYFDTIEAAQAAAQAN